MAICPCILVIQDRYFGGCCRSETFTSSHTERLERGEPPEARLIASGVEIGPDYGKLGLIERTCATVIGPPLIAYRKALSFLTVGI